MAQAVLISTGYEVSDLLEKLSPSLRGSAERQTTAHPVDDDAEVNVGHERHSTRAHLLQIKYSSRKLFVALSKVQNEIRSAITDGMRLMVTAFTKQTADGVNR